MKSVQPTLIRSTSSTGSHASPRWATLAAAGCIACAVLTGCETKHENPAASSAAPPTSAAPASSPLGPLASAAPTASASAEAPKPEREIAGAAHILIAYKGALGAAKTVTRTSADAKKRAEEVQKKAADPKASFEGLVKEYSDDALSKPANGQIGNFERNVMPKAFSDATFSLAVGGISEVVETPRGFHVIRRTR